MKDCCLDHAVQQEVAVLRFLSLKATMSKGFPWMMLVVNGKTCQPDADDWTVKHKLPPKVSSDFLEAYLMAFGKEVCGCR